MLLLKSYGLAVIRKNKSNNGVLDGRAEKRTICCIKGDGGVCQ